MLVLEQHLGELLQIALGVGRARRVRRRVQDQPFGLRRDRRVEILRAQLEAVVLRARDRHGLAVAKQHHLGVGDPVRRWNHHLIAWAQGRHQRVVEDLFAAVADGDLGRFVIESVFAFELAADRALQFDAAVEHGVAGLAALDRGDAGLANVLGCVEIGLALRQRNDVSPRRL
jgi:hypothetical protein